MGLLRALAATIEGCPLGGSAGSVSPLLSGSPSSELQVLRLIVRGGTSEDVARQLGRQHAHGERACLRHSAQARVAGRARTPSRVALESGLF